MKKTVFAAACAFAACAFGEILVKDGDTLAFLGDSIIVVCIVVTAPARRVPRSWMPFVRPTSHRLPMWGLR